MVGRKLQLGFQLHHGPKRLGSPLTSLSLRSLTFKTGLLRLLHRTGVVQPTTAIWLNKRKEKKRKKKRKAI